MSERVATNTVSHALADWAIRTRPCEGERENGDRTIVRPREDGLLVAMVDGLGHGAEAARAADIAVDAITRLAHRPIDAILAGCHAALFGSRGAALGLALLDRQRGLSWLSVGNVDAAHLRASEASRRGAQRPALIVPHAGIVGARLPTVRAVERSLAEGDLVVLATDGIDPALFDALDASLPIDIAVDRLFERYARADDDASIVLLRWKATAS